MKADIPDSIIISRDEDGVLHHSYWTTDQELVPFEATEFIRKDALLELLNKKLQESADRLDYRMNKAYAEILDKLNSM